MVPAQPVLPLVQLDLAMHFAYLRSRLGKHYSTLWLSRSSKSIQRKQIQFKVTHLPKPASESAGEWSGPQPVDNGDDSSNSLDRISPQYENPLEVFDEAAIQSIDSQSQTIPEIKVVGIDERQSKLILLDPEAHSHYVVLRETCMRLTLIYGSVVIDGYRMKVDQTIPCIAMGPYAFTLVEPQACDSSKEQLFTQLSKYITDEAKRSQLIEELKKTKKSHKMTVLLAQRPSDTSLMARVYHQIRSSKFCYIDNQKIFNIFIQSSNSKNDFDQIKAWDAALDEQLTITPSTVLMTLGPSNSGKSMLIKRLINRILSHERQIDSSSSSLAHSDSSSIIFVDLDPGQTEFSPPGILSVTKLSIDSSQPLFPVPFANSLFHSPVFSVSVAAITPQSDPDAYVRGILSIAQFIREKYRNKYPIFVNTIGWISGLGRCLLVDAIKSINPSDVIEIVDSNQRAKTGWTPQSTDASNRPCSLFSFSSVTTPGMGWTAESQIPIHYSLLASYNYIQLNSNRVSERMPIIGQWNRSTQVLTNFLRNDFFHFQGLSFSEKQTLDLTKVTVYSAYSRQQVPSNILSELLDLAWVQLAIYEGHQLQPTTYDSCSNIKIASSLSNNQVIGYGITFIQTKPTSGKENICQNLHDQSGEESFEEVTAVKIVTQLSAEELAKVNLLICPQGVSIPSYILRQAALK